MPAVAVTDTGNLFGALEFATTCAAAGIQPIIGCEIALGAQRRARTAAGPAGMAAPKPDRIVLLAQSETGYRNLLDLVSRSYLDGEAADRAGDRRCRSRCGERGAALPRRRAARSGRAAARRGSGRSRRGVP